MTQREFFNEVITIATENEREDLVIFAQGRIAQIDKKNASSTSKPKKVSEEQVAMRNAILEYLGTVEKASVSEIMVAIGATSNQKVTGNITQLRKLGKIAEPVKIKKVNYYSLT